jgi:GMP synthase-like glutamine amidotransferase
MQVQVLQHMAFEGPGMIGEWAAEQGHSINRTHLYAGDTLPAWDKTDMLVIMGGPMGVRDADKYDWMPVEFDFIHKAIQRKIPTVGICLGAQFIAHLLGARVYRNKEAEIGWFPLTHVDEIFKKVIGVEGLPTFHWHGDTFDLPKGARHLASSKATPNQAFLYDKHVLGLQFHLEVLPSSITDLLDHIGGGLKEANYVQSRDVIEANMEVLCAQNNQMCRNLLSAFIEGLL